MLKKVIILFDKNGFDLSGIKENIDIRCLNIDIKMKCDGYHQLTQNNNFDLNEENNYRYYPNRKIHKIVIDSKIDNGIQATETLIHELCHAVQRDLYGYDCQPHGKEFKAIASKVGLDVSKPTFAYALPYLKAQIQEWEVEVGTYPHPISLFEQIENLIINVINYGGGAYLLVLLFNITTSRFIG
jgi:hypothetical protein